MQPKPTTPLQRRAELLARLLQCQTELDDLRRELLGEDYRTVVQRAHYLRHQFGRMESLAQELLDGK